MATITIRGVNERDKQRLQIITQANGYPTLSEFLRNQLNQIIEADSAHALQTYLWPALS